MASPLIHSFDPSTTKAVTCPECHKQWFIRIEQLEGMILYQDFLKCNCGKTKLHFLPNGDLSFDLIESITKPNILDAIRNPD